MITQPSIFDSTIDDPATRWHAFSAKHPDVYPQIVRLAYERIDAGDRRVSMKLIFELLRRYVPRDADSPVALNNTYTAPATRQLVAEHPDLAPYFHMRERRGSISASVRNGQFVG